MCGGKKRHDSSETQNTTQSIVNDLLEWHSLSSPKLDSSWWAAGVSVKLGESFLMINVGAKHC